MPDPSDFDALPSNPLRVAEVIRILVPATPEPDPLEIDAAFSLLRSSGAGDAVGWMIDQFILEYQEGTQDFVSVTPHQCQLHCACVRALTELKDALNARMKHAGQS